jgi:hypothetical protein
MSLLSKKEKEGLSKLSDSLAAWGQTVNPILTAGVIFLVVGLGVQAYGVAQAYQCAYSSLPKSNCGGLTVIGNSISLFLILAGLMAIIWKRQKGSSGFFASARDSRPSSSRSFS